MKQTLLTRLVLGAIAGVAASGGAYAGQIQASSTSIAREVITVNAQTVIAPTTSYRFAGDVSSIVQAQTFQVQLSLATVMENGNADLMASAALWDVSTVPNNLSFNINDGVSGAALVNGVDFTIDRVGFSTDKKTLWATVTVPTTTGAVSKTIKQPIVTFNANNAGAVRARLVNLKDVVGDLATDYAAGANGLNANCSAVKRMPIRVNHFVALSDPNAIAAAGVNGTADEHIRVGSTNEAVSIVFPTNVKVNVATSSQNAILTPGGNLTFSSAGTGTSFVNANLANLGNFKLSTIGSGYDSNLVSVYAISTVAANGLMGIATAATNIGQVETDKVNVAVTASQGFVSGGSLFLSATANCAAPLAGSTVSTTAAGAAGSVVSTPLTSAAINAGALTGAGTGVVHICYSVPGTSTIPSSSFTGIATVVKAAAGSGFNEQNNACGNPLYSLGGGLKIDVRNYASSKETSGWQSVVRFINNSDAATADVWAQIIHQDGKLGAWGKLTDLTPRASINLTAKQIEAKLTNTATAAIGPNAAVAQPGTTTTSDTAPRLRVTSQSGQSLRVQNYLYNPATGQIIEVSGSQGIDYEGGNILRAPTNDGQYISQDANSGLNLGR